jgi:hypothetical protein
MEPTGTGQEGDQTRIKKNCKTRGLFAMTRYSNSTRRADAMTSAAFGQPHINRPLGHQQRQVIRQLSSSERRRGKSASMPCAHLARLVNACYPTLNLSNSEICKVRLSRNQVTFFTIRMMGSAGQQWLEDTRGLEFDAVHIFRRSEQGPAFLP